MKIINKIIKVILKKLSRVIFHLIPYELHLFFKIIPKEVHTHWTEKETLQCFNHFEKHLRNAIHLDKLSIRKYAIKKSLLNDKGKNKFYLEFGVWKGNSTNFFSKYVNKLYAFDSFEGLREDWVGTGGAKGDYNLNKQIPKLNKNIEPIVGFIQDTLEDFLKKHNPKINFAHLDIDTYESTKYALEKLKPYLIKDSIILFDELYNFPGWRDGGYKALQETFDENEYKFRAFSKDEEQVVIQLN
jgi:hypothetical protein